jgi:hypothetical protein
MWIRDDALPGFGATQVDYLSSPLFGQSTQMLGASLGSGGQNGSLNPQYISLSITPK